MNASVSWKVDRFRSATQPAAPVSFQRAKLLKESHVSRARKYSHIFQALWRLLQPVPADEVVVDFCILNTGIRGLPSGHNLPHGHSKRPLKGNSTQNK